MDVDVDIATGVVEPEAAGTVDDGSTKRITVGGGKGSAAKDFVAECRGLNMTPHVAENVRPRRPSAIDTITTSPPARAISQRNRKRVKEV